MVYGVRICSCTDATGSGTVNGKKFQWDFSEQFGPLFLTSKGVPMRTQPLNGPAWRAFNAWYPGYRAAHPHPVKAHC